MAEYEYLRRLFNIDFELPSIQLRDACDKLSDLYTRSFGDDYGAMIKHNIQLLQIDDHDTPSTMLSKLDPHLNLFARLKLLVSNVVEGSDLMIDDIASWKRGLFLKIDYCACALYSAYHAMVYLKAQNNVKISGSTGTEASLDQFGAKSYITESANSKLPTLIVLREEILQIIYGLKARKLNDRIYFPVIFNGVIVTFKLDESLGNDLIGRSTIESFIYGHVMKCYPNIDMQLLDGGNHVQKVASLLTNMYSNPRFPVLNYDFNLFAFRNCLFNTWTLEFYPYDEIEGFTCARSLDLINRCPVNFIDQYVDFMWIIDNVLNPERYHGESDDAYEERCPYTNAYDLIQTPHFQRILDDQRFERDVCIWKYILSGRLYHKVRQHDSWEVAPFDFGKSGTGKSTWLECATYPIPPHLRGILANKGRDTFSFQHLTDRMVILCMDVDKKLTADKSALNSFITGEGIELTRLYQKSENIDAWTIPVAFAGNEIAFNQEGAPRRFVTFHFNVNVNNGDSRLKDRCKDESALFLVKSSILYHRAVQLFGHRGIWDILPNYFIHTRALLLAESNSLAAFLTYSQQVEIVENSIISKSDFVQRYTEFCEHMKTKKVGIPSNAADVTFGLYSIVLFTDEDGIPHLRGVKSIDI